MGNAPRRPHTNKNSSNGRSKDGKRKHVQVDGCFVKPWNSCGSKGQNRVQTPDGEQNSRERADYRQHSAFDEKLTRYRPSAGAKRGPHRNLTAASEGASEL